MLVVRLSCQQVWHFFYWFSLARFDKWRKPGGAQKEGPCREVSTLILSTLNITFTLFVCESSLTASGYASAS